MAAANMRAQVAILCDLCDSDKDVKWKCIDCDERLCQQCKTAHMKSRASSGHNVIDRITSETNEEQLREKRQYYCTTHPGEAYIMYCKNCKTFVCLSCVTGQHQKHEFVKVDDLVKLKQKQFSQEVTNLKQDQIQKLHQKVKYLKQNQESYSTVTPKIIAEVKCQGEKLKTDVDGVTKQFVENIQTKQKKDMQQISSEQEKLTKQINDLNGTIKIYEEKAKQCKGRGLIKVINEAMVELAKHKDQIPPHTNIHSAWFKPNKYSRMSLQQMYGSLDLHYDDVVKSISPSKLEPKVVFKFQIPQHGIGHITKILPTGKYTAWLVCPDWLVKKDGDEIDCVCNYVSKAAVTKEGYVLTSTTCEPTIFIMKKQTYSYHEFENNIEQFNTESGYVQDMSVTSTNDVLATSVSFHSPNDDGKIVRLSPQGKIKHIIQYDKKGKPLFKKPKYITQNTKDNNIWVSDIGDNSVLVVSETGQIMFKYLGPPTKIKGNSPFSPRGLVSNKNGEMLIVDELNNNVQLVSGKGEFLQYLLSEKDGLDSPIPVAIDDKDRMWVGYGDTVIIVNYRFDKTHNNTFLS